MSNIFADNAPRLWAAGLPAIPLRPYDFPGKGAGKAPFIDAWSLYCTHLPTEEDQRQWVVTFPNGNVGMPLGPCSGVIALDIDTADPAVIEMIEEIIPNRSGYKRIGQKGYVTLFKYRGEKTFQIKDENKQVICELLSNGRQMVLPPSVHPKTKLPYQETMPFLEAVKNLPEWPENGERVLRAALQFKGVKLSVSGYSRVTDWVPKSARDTAYTRVCGIYAAEVIRGKRTLLEAIRHVEEWPHTFAEQVAGDDLDPADGVRKLIRFVTRDVVEKDMPLRQGWDDGLSKEDKERLGLDFGIEHQEMTLKEIQDELVSSMEVASDTQAKLNVVQSTLKRIRRSPSLTETEIEHLLKSLSTYPGVRVGITTLRKQLKALYNDGLIGESHYEIAEHMRKELAEKELFRYHQGQFWVWEGSHWAPKPDFELQNHIITNYGSLAACKKHNDYQSVLKTFQNLVTADLEDVSAHGVNFANGFLTEDLTLIDHNPAFGMTYRLPYRYLPEQADGCPRFFRFLEDCWGGDEDFEAKKTALQQAICSTIFGTAAKIQRAILLYGIAHSGKSVLLRIVEGLIPPDRVSAVSPDQWDDRFLPAQLVGKTLNIGGELHEKHKIDGQRFKQIVGGDSLEVQRKLQQPFRFNPTCAHWFASNYLPNSDDTTEGFLRRWLFLTFTKAFPEEKRNVNLAEDIIAEEREAIAAWAVQAQPGLAASPAYTIPESHRKRVEEVLAGNDSVYFFIRNSPKIQIIPSLSTVGENGDLKSIATSARTLFSEYQTFTANMGARPVMYPRFLQIMREKASTLGVKEAMSVFESGFPEPGFLGLMLRTANMRARL